MSKHRDIKRKARRRLHEKLSVEAMYLVPIPAPVGSSGPGPFYDTPELINVRIQERFDTAGDMKGTSLHYAERQIESTVLVFDSLEVDKPARNAIVSIETGLAYRVDNTKPQDDQWFFSEVKRLPKAETVGLPIPDGAP